jgi:deoxycytidylate deaminase
VLSWEDYFMATAVLAAKRSKDPCSQVGACIVNDDKKIVGIGYNGMPTGCSDDDFPWTKKEKHLYGKTGAHSSSRPADVNCQFFIVKKINADIKFMHYITALTESEFLYVFKCKDMLLFKPDF